MGSSNRYILKTIVIFHILFFFSHLHTRTANANPTAQDINSLAEQAFQTTGTFMQNSFQFRMEYEYSGKFPTSRNREKLLALVKRANDQLLEIAEEQRNIKQQIEDYQGDDWDERYGSTGLWRKLSSDLHTTNEYKCLIDFYLATAAQLPQRNIILHKILTQLGSLNTAYSSAESQLLRARIYSLLSQTDSSYKPSAKQEFDMLMERSDMRDATVFKTAIERIKLFGPTAPDQLKTLAEGIAKSRCKNNIELVFSLAFLQRRYEPESLETTVQIWPQTEDLLGSLALSDLSNRIEEGRLTTQYLQQLSVFEAELAAHAAWKNKSKEYKTLLGRLSSAEKFQTPLILYVSAIALSDSSPAEAVNLLIKASMLQSTVGGQKSNKLNIEAHEIARQAAQLAYGAHNNKAANCRLTVEAFGNYHTLAAEKIDEKLEYLYTTILGDCGQSEKRTILLDKIANRPAGRWRNRAKLDLITTALQQNRFKNQEKHSELLMELDELITDCRNRKDDNSQLQIEAINVYCRLLLQSKQADYARKVLDILTEVEIAIDPDLNIFKAHALRQLGKLDAAAECLCEAANSNSGKYIEAMELLSEIIDKIDYYQAKLDGFPKMVKDCYILACYCCDYAPAADSRRAALMLAEISLFLMETEPGEPLTAHELVESLAKQGDTNDTDLLRCKARLLTAQGKFAEAAQSWAHLAGIQKNDLHKTTQRNWKWWRAKFYELDCFAKMPQTEKQHVLHSIEVLESSFTDIPPLWAEKLNLLKQNCRISE